MQNNFDRVIPELPAGDIAQTLNYYRDVLGYEVAGQQGNFFGSVLRGKANLYFSKSDEKIMPNRCYILVNEVDELCQIFKDKGATI